MDSINVMPLRLYLEVIAMRYGDASQRKIIT